MPIPPARFVADARPIAAERLDGLAAAIDRVADGAAPSHRFLRYGWYAAALRAYGGAARTLIVRRAGEAVIALPFVPVGPAAIGLATVPGCYWPFRSFPVRLDAVDDAAVGEALLDALGRSVRALRLGPVMDGDPALMLLRTTAAARGWVAIDRFVADSYLLDMAAMQAAGCWPRNSTLRKNRSHEKHLAAEGTLDWQFCSGADWGPALFESLATIEQRSWIAARTDGRDAKFTAQGHGAFWRAAAADPVLAATMSAALLRVDGAPVAFSFDLDAGALRYAIANSYDPAFARYSPGKLLQYRNLTRAVAAGIERVDWGAGDSGYKREIGAEQGAAIRDWLFFRPGAGAMAGRLLRRRWARSGNAPALAD